MLSRSFKDQIYDISKTSPPNIQVCLLSATMPPENWDLTTEFMRDAVRILVKKDESTLEGIHQFMSPSRRRSGSLARTVICLKHLQSQPMFMAASGGTSVCDDSDRLRIGQQCSAWSVLQGEYWT